MVEKKLILDYWQKHSWKEVVNHPTNSGEVRSPVLLFQSIRFAPQSEVILVVCEFTEDFTFTGNISKHVHGIGKCIEENNEKQYSNTLHLLIIIEFNLIILLDHLKAGWIMKIITCEYFSTNWWKNENRSQN